MTKVNVVTIDIDKMSMEEQIVQKLGKNSTGNPGQIANPDIQFEEVELSDGSTVSSCYTYIGTVCIIDDIGLDNDFEDYSEEDQKLIYDAIMKIK